MKKTLALAKIEAAKVAITEAEADLEQVLKEIRIAPRAEKTTVGAVIEDAFTKLRAARTELADVERMVEKDDE